MENLKQVVTMKASKKDTTNIKKLTRYCVNCQNHREKNPISGHKNKCLYKDCGCKKCTLTNHVKVVSLLERKNHKQITPRDEIKSESSTSYCSDGIDTQARPVVELRTFNQIILPNNSPETTSETISSPEYFHYDGLNDVEEFLPLSFPTSEFYNTLSTESSEVNELPDLAPLLDPNMEDWTKFLNI